MARKIITVGEHQIELPPLPSNKDDILFVHEKKNDAYWRRIEFPKIWYDFNPLTKVYQHDTVYDDNDGILISLSYEDSELLKRLLIQENKRRSKGVWMKNYDQFEWLAPSYYYNLQWCQMKDLAQKYGDFREPQNQVLTLWHYVKHKWEWCNGLVLPKCKKSGITQIIAGDYVNEATQQKGWEMAVMSKEYDHAVDVAMAYFFHAFDNLPYIMQPDLRKRNEHEVVFGTPVARIGTRSHKTKDKKEVLNTRVAASKTKPTGFDGPVVRQAWISEMPKTWEASKVSPDALHKKVRETVRLQQKKNGALIYESYMPEIDDRGFREFREICKQSELSTKNPDTGKTESSMIVLELTAVDSNEVCFDKHGRCDRRKALHIINTENNGLKTLSDKQAHRRQYPRDRNDMYDSGGRGTVFDNTKLALVKRELENEAKSGHRPWKEVNLRWANSLWETGKQQNRRPYGQFAMIYEEVITDDELASGVEGSLKIFHDLPDKMLNQVVQRNHRDEDGEYLAPIDSDNTMVAGCDPTDYALKRDVREGSKVAVIGGFLYNPAMDTEFKKTISNTPMFEYEFRHENPDDDLEMIIKIILYYNVRIVIEANKKWVVTAVKREGLQHFLLLKQSDGSIRPYQKGDEQRLVSTDHGMIDAYIRAIRRWWAGTVDYMKTYRSLNGLQQAMDFDPTETKKFNNIVALGYWRIAVDSYSVFKLENAEKSEAYSADGIEEAVMNLLDF